MSAPLEISSRLLNSRLMTTTLDSAVLKGFETGANPTISAGTMSRRQSPVGYGRYGENSRQKRIYDRRQSRGRKREMGGNGRLPNTLRCWFTEGERAVLYVIGDEVKRRGKCELKVEAIASKAGVSIRLVQYTIATAAGRSKEVLDRPVEERPPLLLVVEYRPRARASSLPNVIKIVSREWINWLSYKPSEAPAVEAAEEGQWSIVDAYAGQLPRVLGIGCRKMHTSLNPYIGEVEGSAVTDNWQRQRMGLPVTRGSGGGARARGRPAARAGGRGDG